MLELALELALELLLELALEFALELGSRFDIFRFSCSCTELRSKQRFDVFELRSKSADVFPDYSIDSKCFRFT